MVASEVVVVASVVVAVHAEHPVAVVDSAAGAEEASPEEEEEGDVVPHEEVEGEALAAQGEGEGTRDALLSRDKPRSCVSSPSDFSPPHSLFASQSESLFTFPRCTALYRNATAVSSASIEVSTLKDLPVIEIHSGERR